MEKIVGELLGKNNEKEVAGNENNDKLMKKGGNEEIENPNKNLLEKKEIKEESENIFLNKKTKRNSPWKLFIIDLINIEWISWASLMNIYLY